MAALTLEQFLGAGPDMERAQYQILGGLATVRRAFSQNRIYPHLSELIALHGTLRKLFGQLGDMQTKLKTDLEDVDLEKMELTYKPVPRGPMAGLEDLIEWALPHVRETIEEGRTIFEFVDDALHLEEVGIVPKYLKEGYLLLPDLEAEEIRVYRYGLSIVIQSNERFRGLRTSLIKKLPHERTKPPQNIKVSLARELPDLPNPATYLVDSEIGFPFEETVLPIAKRKLMRFLCGPRGLA